jgi:hypothetical protein
MINIQVMGFSVMAKGDPHNPGFGMVDYKN